MEIQIARLEAHAVGKECRLDNNAEFIMNTDAPENDASEPIWRGQRIQATRIEAPGPSAPVASR
jgi:hypothetical protein